MLVAICETSHGGDLAKTGVNRFSVDHQARLSFQYIEGLIFPNPKTGFSFQEELQWKLGIVIKQESRAYFRTLGAHVTAMRKSRGMTQAELARAIGVSQQAVFAYELGERRISVLILVKLAKVFGISVEEMMGLTKPARVPKGRLSPRAVRNAQRLQALTKTQQRFVVRIIDVLEQSNAR